MRNRYRAALAASAALAVGGLSASALSHGQEVGTLDTSCPSGNTCVWKGTNWTGEKKVIGNSPEGVWVNLTGTFDNNIESLKNHFSNRSIRFAQGYNGTNSVVCWNAGAEVSNVHFPFTNTISSYKVGQAGGNC
jgi:hypothetical protein